MTTGRLWLDAIPVATKAGGQNSKSGWRWCKSPNNLTSPPPPPPPCHCLATRAVWCLHSLNKAAPMRSAVSNLVRALQALRTSVTVLRISPSAMGGPPLVVSATWPSILPRRAIPAQTAPPKLSRKSHQLIRGYVKSRKPDRFRGPLSSYNLRGIS